MYGPAVRCNVWSGRALQEVFIELAFSGLASMYPVSDWSCFAPDHHGYQRACGLIVRQTSMGQLGHQFSHAPGRPILHLFSSSRRPRWVSVELATSSRIPHFSASVAVCVAGIRRIGSRPDPSSVLRRPGHEPEHSRRCGRVCWREQSPARCDGAASWLPRSRA